MDSKKIERINELARKSRTDEGLSEAEKEEQQILRKEYIDAVKASLTGQLDNTSVLRPDGTKEKLSRKNKNMS